MHISISKKTPDNVDRRKFLGIAARIIGTGQLGVITSRGSQLPIEGEMPSLSGATEWLNSRPLTRKDLHEKVILIDFWTYSCINWRRTLPYVRAWAEKYKDHGLIVIGVHTPEFPFEKDVANIGRAAKAMSIDYPIAIDSEYAIWRAFNNEYWPALYFVDSQGYIRAHKFGEGDYQQSELVIQQMLAKAGEGRFNHEPVSVDPTGAEVAADWANLKSGETYTGHERTEGFASPGGLKPKKCRTYTLPAKLKLNHWGIAGDWTAEKQSIVLGARNGGLAYQFHARDLNLVMGPTARSSPIRFRVLLDGRPPGAAHGVDTDEQGNGVVTEPRMYQMIRQSNRVLDRKFEIEFADPGVEAFSLTFG